MARAGRKRKTGKREPNGRISRAGQPRRSPVMDVMEQPHRRGLRGDERKSQAAATALGQAWLHGLLHPVGVRPDRAQEVADARYAAGQRWGSLVGQMLSAVAAPVRVGNSISRMVAPGIEEPPEYESRDEPETDEERCARVLGIAGPDDEYRSGGQYDRAKRAIARAVQETAGEAAPTPADWWVFAALDLVIVRNQPVTDARGTLQALCFGLDALVEHWRLSAPAPKMRAAMVDGARPIAGIVNPSGDAAA